MNILIICEKLLFLKKKINYMSLIELKEELGYKFYCTNNIKKADILKLGQGLYGWIYKSEFEDFQKNGFPEAGIKYGQYGSGENYEDKNPLITTARNFKGGINKDSIVFVYHRSFSDINQNNPLITAKIIENQLKKENENLRNKETKSKEVYRISTSDYNVLVDRKLRISINDVSDLYPRLHRPRWYQGLFVDIYNKYYLSSNIILLSFGCGKGKSLTISHSLVSIYEMIVNDVILITTKPSTLDQYANRLKSEGYLYTKDIIEKYYIVYLDDEVNSEKFNYDLIKERSNGKKIMFITSKQFLDSYLSTNKKGDKSKFNESFIKTMKDKISLVISDEGHWGANSEISNKIHNEDLNDLNEDHLSLFSKDVRILYSTATPGSLLFKYNLDRKYQFYLDNEIESKFLDFLENPNDYSYNEYLETISNGSDELKENIDIFTEKILKDISDEEL